MSLGLPINREEVITFCQRHHLRKLALFGSVLRGDFRPDSDVDVLVEFEPDHVPGLIALMNMQAEFSALIGRPADFRAPGDLHRSFRDAVAAEAEVLYAAWGHGTALIPSARECRRPARMRSAGTAVPAEPAPTLPRGP